MLEGLKKQVCEANRLLQSHNLVLFTWGNVSGIDRKTGYVVIKPSGIAYDELQAIDMCVVDLDGNRIEGEQNPSSDTPTHLELYRSFPNIGGVTHTHSQWATAFAQSGRGIKPYGTTHADYFDGTIPCTRKMTPWEISEQYEKETGRVILEAFSEIDPDRMPAVLVHSHGPFTWGKTPKQSVEYATILENIAMMAFATEILQKGNTTNGGGTRMQEDLLRKHFDRKHGPNAYYGQPKK